MADWFTEIAQQRWDQLDAEEAQCHAQLKYAKANDDREYGVERIAELESIAIRRKALKGRHAQYLRDQQPPYQIPETETEWRERRPERMNYDDVAKIAAKSKYGFDDTKFREGINEVARRRARGE